MSWATRPVMRKLSGLHVETQRIILSLLVVRSPSNQEEWGRFGVNRYLLRRGLPEL